MGSYRKCLVHLLSPLCCVWPQNTLNALISCRTQFEKFCYVKQRDGQCQGCKINHCRSCCCHLSRVRLCATHRRQPNRLPRPWDSPGKNTGVGCHFLFQCMKMKSEIEVAQSCPALSDPMDCSLPGSSAHGIFQARVLEWGAIAFSKMHNSRRKRVERKMCKDELH